MKIKNSNHKVAIFCGSMFGSNKEYKNIAVKVTQYLARKKYDIVYGGGENGLMGVVANTALKNKAHVTGIIPNFLESREAIHRQIDDLHITKTMEQRKKKFLSISDSFIALPGGGGTIEEIGLVLSALQLGVIKNKKFIIFNHKNYWSDLIKQYQKTIAQGFAYKSFSSYLKVCKNLSDLKKIY
tara:strand:- start:51 stop:602 length:552 start_codon:yes stop_codon:yes gene_type:complete